MQKRKRLLIAVTALGFCAAAPVASAAPNPFSDVPKDHWAYEAVEQLAQDGVIEGYGDATYRGERAITRYEMAQLVAKAMAKADATPRDQVAIDKLAAEFRDELASFGVRIAEMEQHTDNVKWDGGYAQKYMRSMHTGPEGKRGEPYWEKEFWLNATAAVPGTGFTVHADFDNKWGGRYHDQEVANDEEWVDGSTRTSGFHLDKVYVEGPLWKTGQKVTLGNFQPWTQDGFVDDASLKGAMFEHYGSKFTTHVFGGHLDAKVWDMAMDAEVESVDGFTEGWLFKQSPAIKNAVGASEAEQKRIYIKTAGKAGAYNNWTDNVRYVPESKRQMIIMGHHATEDWGTNNSVDWSQSKNYAEEDPNKDQRGGDRLYVTGNKQRMDYYGAVVDYKYSKKLSGSLGWHHFRSAAYAHEWLDIGAATLHWKMLRNLNFTGAYAHGNQHGNDNAWNLELQFRGDPGIPSDRPGLFSCYLAYRYLGPDALVKTNLGDGIGQGQKGWEVGMFYNLMKHCQFSVKYGRGKSLTNPVHPDRAKVYSCLSWNF